MNDDIFNYLTIALLQLDGWGFQSVKVFLETNKKIITNSKLTLADIEELSTNIDDKRIKNLIKKITPKNWSLANKQAIEILEQTKQNNVEILNFLSPGYPVNLKIIPNCPAILYVKGNSEILDNELYPSLATIGTRKPLEIVQKLTDHLIRILVEKGFITVSGLALGTDSICHDSTLKYGGRTIAILSNGLDSVYPKKNQKLANKILENGGVLISTNPLGTKVTPANLVERDKWQAGISDGVVAMQTSEKGGTTHAMKASQKYQRPLAILNLKADKNTEEYSKIAGNIKCAEYAKDHANANVFPISNLQDIDKFLNAVKNQKEKRLKRYKKELNNNNVSNYVRKEDIPLF